MTNADTTNSTQFRDCLQSMDAFLADMQTWANPATRAKATEMLGDLLGLHAAGLCSILEKISAAGEPGDKIIQSLLADPAVSGLMILHELHPLSLEQRVEAALESTRPYLHSHGGNVELLGINPDGVVKLQLHGSCHGCPSSRATLKGTIETALYQAAPDITGIAIEGAEDEPAPQAAAHPEIAPGFVSMENLTVQGQHIHAQPAALCAGGNGAA